MKDTFLTVLLSLLLVSPAVAAQRGTCAPYAAPITLDFKTLTPPPVYNNRLNVTGIRNLFREHNDSVLGPHQRALGITYALTSFSMQGSTVIKPVPGGYCTYIDRVEADFGWKRMDVFVASEFQPGTCEYRAILDHENQHVSVNNGALKEYAPRFRAALESVLAEQKPVFTASQPRDVDGIFEKMSGRMSVFLERFQQLMATRNGPLDSASNYGETAKLCTNWDGETPPRKR